MISVDTTILSWDRSEDTLAAISSALQQEGIQGKVFVVDQGSSPDNITKLREFAENKQDLTVVYNKENLGVPGGRNCGALQGKGKYIVSLDNDAEFADEHQLAKATEIMEANPDIAVLAFRILRYGSTEDDWSSWPYGSTDKWPSDSSFYTTKFVGAGHMIRREAFEAIGGYDNKLFFMHEEVDLSKRFINSGFKIRYSHEVVIGHKVSAEHRVPWSSTRTLYDVRNSVYLAAKLNTEKGFLNTLLMLIRQFSRNLKRGQKGVVLSSIKGLCLGVALVPRAIRIRKEHPETKSNRGADEYYELYAHAITQTFSQKVLKKLSRVFS